MWVFFREAKRVLQPRDRHRRARPRTPIPGQPILVCCRHAGPGDSFVLIHALMHWYGREPRVVLKNTLAWDPAIDVLLHRIPARFISPNPGGGQDLEEQIAALATGLDENDAFVIFPEGGNFTERRRDRGIERLRKLGLEGMAERAEAMTNVLAPRPGGFLAALDAAPEADVVLVAHTGLDHVVTVGDIWRELPMDKRIVMRWWRVPRAEIPEDRDERIEWLFGWWERIDVWIDANRPALSTARERYCLGSVGERRRTLRPASSGEVGPRRARSRRIRAGARSGAGDQRGLLRGLRRGPSVAMSTTSAGSSGRGHRLRLVGRVGDRLVGGGAAGVVDRGAGAGAGAGVGT